MVLVFFYFFCNLLITTHLYGAAAANNDRLSWYEVVLSMIIGLPLVLTMVFRK
jgi:hypothetical protein